MKTQPWKDVRNSAISPERRAQIASAVDEEVRAFQELETALGITQEDLDRLAAITHEEASQLEAAGARRVARLEQVRELVEALGGNIEVFAVLRDKRVRVL